MNRGTRLQTSDFRHKTSDFRLQTSDTRLQTSDTRLQTSDIRLQTSDTRHQTSDFRLQTQDFGHQTSDTRLQISDTRHQTPDFGHKTSDTRLQTSDFRLQTPDTRWGGRDIHHSSFIIHHYHIRMNNLFTLFFFCLLINTLHSQSARRPALRPEQIAAARKALKTSFLMDDPAAVTLWMDSLARLEDDFYTGLVWDERWLLYYWLETYGNLTDEAARFDLSARERSLWKVQPPRDSLFETIDSALYENRYTLFTQISRSFLNEEERAFTTLQLEYLLRLDPDKDAWREKLDAFMFRYPDSRFNEYLRTLRPPKITATQKHRGFQLLLQTNRWNGDIERSVRPGFGFDFGYSFGKRRMNYLVDFGVSWQKIGHAIDEEDVDGNRVSWLKNDPASQFSLGLETGYDIKNVEKVRLWPAIGFGLSWLGPTPPSEEEDPLPDYYSNFNYFSIHPRIAFNADIKFKKSQSNAQGGYSGIRLRLGYQWMNYGQQNDALQGNMFFFAAGFTLYHRKKMKT